MFKVACIGECMIELAPVEADLLRQGFAGDTFNTAVYFKRQFGNNIDVSYITALGRDALSAAMIKRFDEEQIETSCVRILPDGQPGLYLIENDDRGDRSFQYWRSSSAARSMFKDMTDQNIYGLLRDFDLIFLSGITLAILDEAQRQSLFSALARLKKTTLIGFDPNFRPALWPDLNVCSNVFASMAKVASIVLSTFDDDIAIWNTKTVQEAAARWIDWGVPEVVIKEGSNGCSIFAADGKLQVKPPNLISPIDTTGAGDSFCAGYLGGLLTGASHENAALLAHQVAAQVIQHPGGVISRDVWSPVKQES